MERVVAYQDYKIHVTVEGEGEPLLFLHGWPTNSRLWQAQIDQFSVDYKVIALDWLGFGKSDKPLNYTYTLTSKKEIIDAVVNDVLNQPESLTIVAHDIGGPPAILWASQHQERVKQLVLLNTILFPFSTPLDRISHFSFKVPLLSQLLVSNFYLKNLMKTFAKTKGKEISQRISSILNWHYHLNSTIKLKTILEPIEFGRMNEIPTLENKLMNINVPTSLIVAQQDPLCYAHMAELMKRTPELPVFFIDNCGHYIPIDHPQALNTILTSVFQNDYKDTADQRIT